MTKKKEKASVNKKICFSTYCVPKKLLTFYFCLFFLFSFLYYYKFVSAQVNFQGVKAGMPVSEKFLCDPKTGEAKQTGKFDFVPMTEMKSGGGGGTKITYCPTGTCDTATDGSKSVEKNPFTKKEIMGANKVKIQGGKKICVDGKKAEQVGNKKMDFPKDEPPQKELSEEEKKANGEIYKDLFNNPPATDPFAPKYDPIGPNESLDDYAARNPKGACRLFSRCFGS